MKKTVCVCENMKKYAHKNCMHVKESNCARKIT